MKIRNVSALNDFVAVLDACESQVWLESPTGSRWNLKWIDGIRRRFTNKQ